MVKFPFFFPRDKLGDLATKVASVEKDLKWIAKVHSAYAEAEVAGTEEAPVVVD